MRMLKVYLETISFNFVFADYVIDKREDTLKLFAEVKQCRYELYASEYVLQGLHLIPNFLKTNMLNLFK